MSTITDGTQDAPVATALRSRHLLGIADLSPDEITLILDTADAMKEVASRPIKKVPALRGKTVVNLFFEPSTRTRTSFEIAEKRLSADTLNIAIGTSSVVKGETLVDTVLNLEAMRPDMIVMRHASSGAAHLLSRICRAAVINAGDGAHEHPTQGLLDIMTIREHRGSLQGLTVALVGDIAHSRVARSNIHGLRKLGARVRKQYDGLYPSLNATFNFTPDLLGRLGVADRRRLEQRATHGRHFKVGQHAGEP